MSAGLGSGFTSAGAGVGSGLASTGAGGGIGRLDQSSASTGCSGN
ncbi:MAG: hypothetical protein ACOZBV_09000 [Pseudomonadota bacterium]